MLVSDLWVLFYFLSIAFDIFSSHHPLRRICPGRSYRLSSITESQRITKIWAYYNRTPTLLARSLKFHPPVVRVFTEKKKCKRCYNTCIIYVFTGDFCENVITRRRVPGPGRAKTSMNWFLVSNSAAAAVPTLYYILFYTPVLILIYLSARDN